MVPCHSVAVWYPGNGKMIPEPGPCDVQILKENAYHHGDLRRALLDAAARLVAREGAARVSLRAIAREAGVSHAAPYHHFADREALLAGVAASGFDRLRAAMEEGAASVAAADPLRRLQGAGVAYVRFAVGNPEVYRLMFGGLLADRTRYPELREATESAFAVLLRLLDSTDAGAGSDADAFSAVATATWSTVHGLAFLMIEGLLEREVAAAGAEGLARRVTTVLGRGLGTPDE